MGGLNGLLGGLVHWVETQPGVALLSLILVNTLILILVVMSLTKIQKLNRRQTLMLRGVDGGSLENLLLDYSQQVPSFKGGLERALTVGQANETALRQTLRRVGLYRYDAFANVGGMQSFSLALLDEGTNGVVLTGLYSRQDVRIYAKPIVKGRSEVTLTPEEQRAISEARLPAEQE
jgi:hypothetical protein